MNVFRLVGDVSHLLGMIFLLCKICTSKSCTGLSGKTQLLLSLVFTARYVDLFIYVVSIYNSIMKVCFISSSYATVYVIYVHFKSTNSSEQDTFRANVLALAAMCLALVVNYGFSFTEILWAFSIYLESVAIIPQIYLTYKIGRSDLITGLCLFINGGYRGNYIFNWIYRYHTQGFQDPIAVVSGFVQVSTYCFFLFVYFFRKSPQQTKDVQGSTPDVKYAKLETVDQELEHV